MQQDKYRLLFKSILFDSIGMFSYAIPLIGEYADIAWAPIAAFILYKMYPGTVGKIGSLVTFVEELFPFIDVIPTFTLTWIYKFILSEKPKEDNLKIKQ